MLNNNYAVSFRVHLLKLLLIYMKYCLTIYHAARKVCFSYLHRLVRTISPLQEPETMRNPWFFPCVYFPWSWYQ